MSLKTVKVEYWVLGLIYVLYLGTAIGYAQQTPRWQVPDEPAHYNYVRQIVENNAIPAIEAGDWDQHYQELLTAYAFYPILTGEESPEAWNDPAWRDKLARINRTPHDYAVDVIDPQIEQDIRRVQYEDHQPPLYYLLQSVVYRLTDGDLIAMRIFSAVIGSGVILWAWGIVRLLFPAESWLRLSAAGFVAFIPQRLAMMGGVGNDSLAEFMAGMVLFGVVFYLTCPLPSLQNRLWWLPLAMGVSVGLAFLTKTTVYYVSGIAGVAIVMRWWRDRWPWRFALQHCGLYLVPALLLGGIWWLHGLNTYGGTDFLGLQEHDAVVVGQLKREDYIRDQLQGNEQEYWDNLTETTFHSFWGQFGWMSTPLPQPRLYKLLLLGVIAVLAGVGVYVSQPRWWAQLTHAQLETMALFEVSVILVFLQFLLYNQTFVQFQGRYLYPALIPMALLFALGLSGWSQMAWIPAAWVKWTRWLPIVISLGMVILAWYCLRDVVSTLPTWN